MRGEGTPNPMLRVTLRPPRCYIGPWRIHHALPGLALLAAGLVLLASDLKDFPWSVRT